MLCSGSAGHTREPRPRIPDAEDYALAGKIFNIPGIFPPYNSHILPLKSLPESGNANAGRVQVEK